MAAYFKIGKCYELMGNWDLAENYYNRIIKESPSGSIASNAAKYQLSYVALQTENYEKIIDFSLDRYLFKGYIDLVLKTSDGKYHIIDWKTCSWGWASRRKTEKMTTYQLALYKYFWSKKHAVSLDLSLIHI